MDKFAHSKGGKCISIFYKNNKQKLTWKCADGHIWEARPNDVISGNSWCNKCNINYTEEKCRFILEQLLDVKFPQKFRFLKGIKNSLDKNISLDLDGYSSELNVAFEYNGEQHYKYIPHFHRNIDSFEFQKERDELKKIACNKVGIHLLIIPYTEKRNLPLYINKLLLENNLLPKISPKEIDFSIFNPSKQKIKELNGIAKLKGGLLISEIYNDPFEKMTWECAKGHLFLRSANEIKNGDCWCQQCNYDNRK
ncbi:hypothetical protein [uncultured Aquimarina sp.]|uniref:zinc-ribbon domain-containing protein n=1 Tax=uncultured Aquimarina sp. TaxID=575652 RepID=UPI00260CDEE4|nr:hypothetical protein [uncultured Aquimarina sp.]